MAEALMIERLSADSPHVAMVAEWTHAAWGHLNPGMTFNDAIERLRGECGADGVPSVFVAMHDGVPVGTASLVVDDMSDRPDLTPWLASVFVPPEWRGRGIASSLVQRVEAEARDTGIAVFHLYTPDQQALYARLGWQAIEVREYRGETVTIMRRRFDADAAVHGIESARYNAAGR